VLFAEKAVTLDKLGCVSEAKIKKLLFYFVLLSTWLSPSSSLQG
jgi:hypothetical protein